MSEEIQSGSANGFGYERYDQSFVVPFAYPVYFTRRLFDVSNPLLSQVMNRLGENRRHRALVYVDGGAAGANPGLLGAIKEYFHARPHEVELAAPPEVLIGGEKAKSGWAAVREVMWTIGNLHLDRQSFVVAVGGGGLLDMTGFAASIVHRGLRLIRVPTTTLAQNDAGVGVKNGMDEHEQKNFVGTFAPPWAVLNDFDFLRTLPMEQWLGGVSEAFKVAIIKDAPFFDWLCEKAPALANRDESIMEDLVRRTAILHLRHIAGGGDPFEFGSARPLDFGHWAAHKLEILSNYSLYHGQAVGVGVALDSCYAAREGLITAAECERILAGLAGCGLPIWSPLLERRTAEGTLAILEGLEQFREHLGGALAITLPKGLGGKVEVHQMNPVRVEEAAAFLKTCAGGSKAGTR